MQNKVINSPHQVNCHHRLAYVQALHLILQRPPVAVRSLLTFEHAEGDLWRNPDARLKDRVADLLKQLTIDELISSLDATTYPTGDISRLGIPGFTGWNGEAYLMHK